MQSINSGFQSLKTLIPHSDGEKLSKVTDLFAPHSDGEKLSKVTDLFALHSNFEH